MREPGALEGRSPRRKGDVREIQSEHGRAVMKDYHVNIFWSDEDECYVADIPDLKYCSAFGDTPEHALAEVEQAKEGWLAVAREQGKPIPEPRYRPAIYQLGKS